MKNIKHKYLLLYSILLYVLLPCGMTVFAEAPSETLMTEDFKNETLVNWEKEKMGDSADIFVSNGELCLRTGAYRDNPRVYPKFSASINYEFISVEFMLRLEGAAQSRQFSLRDSADNWFNVFSYCTDKKVALGQSASSNTEIILENGKNYNIRYEIYNSAEKTYASLFINNSYIGDIDAPANWSGSLKKIYFIAYAGSDGVSETYIDNVVVEVKPEEYYYNPSFPLSVDALRFSDKDGRCYYLSDGQMIAEASIKAKKDTLARLVLVQYLKKNGGLSLRKIESSHTRISSGENVKLTVPIDIENAENSVVKVFLFDSFDKLTPIIPVTYLFSRWDSTGVAHPNSVSNYNYVSFLGYSERERIFSENEAFLKKELEPFLSMEETAFISYIEAVTGTRLYLDTPAEEAELICQRLASLYKMTNDEKCAKYSALAMYTAAQSYENTSKLISNKFFSYMNIIPAKMVYAYDIIYNSNSFNELSESCGADVKTKIEDYFFKTVMDMYNALNERIYTNITPYGIEQALLVAVTLNHSDLIRLFIPWIDTILSGKHYYADGMWQEGTVDYHKQVTEGLVLAVSKLNACFRDAAGYKDFLLGISLPKEDIEKRWPVLSKARNIERFFKYPDGRTVCVNDTSFDDPFTKSAEDEIFEKYLTNVTLSNFKHYSLVGGDTVDANAVVLNFEAQSLENAHSHTDYLSMTYWGAGTELLPDAGYPRGSGTPQHSFFKSPLAHNTTWVWNKDTNYSKSKSKHCVQSALLAYDGGENNNKQVQLTEASQNGQNYDFADIKRRALLTIKISDNRFYTVDINRLKGGNAHELFLRSSEDEDVRLSTDLLLEKNEGTLKDYFEKTGKNEGLTVINGSKNLRELCLKPMVSDGSRASFFSWTGEKTNSTLNVFLNDVQKSDIVFSKIPSLRRAKNDISLFDDYFSMQLYRRRIVPDNSVTKYGAVLEAVREKQTSLIKNVQWLYPADSKDMAISVKVTFDGFYDIIYLSDDNEKRNAFGVEFSANYAVIRIDNNSNVVWGYIYSGESIKYGGEYFLLGYSDKNSLIYDTVTDSSFGQTNEIIVDKMNGEDTFTGNYVMCMLNEEFGYGFKITGAYNENGRTHFAVNDTLPFKMQNGVAELIYHDGMILDKEEGNKKNYYNMLSVRQFDSPKSIVKFSVFKRE